MYKFISLKELRPKLAKVVEKIDQEMDRYIVSKRGEPVVVMIGLDDFESIVETLNETSDKENLKRLRKAMKEAKSGRTVDWKIVKKRLGLES